MLRSGGPVVVSHTTKRGVDREAFHYTAVHRRAVEGKGSAVSSTAGPIKPRTQHDIQLHIHEMNRSSRRYGSDVDCGISAKKDGCLGTIGESIEQAASDHLH